MNNNINIMTIVVLGGGNIIMHIVILIGIMVVIESVYQKKKKCLLLNSINCLLILNDHIIHRCLCWHSNDLTEEGIFL